MDIISPDCLSRIKFNEKNLVPVHYPIIGFGVGVIHAIQMFTSPIRVGEKDVSQILLIKFLVARVIRTYNIVLGLPTLNQVKAVIVTHLMHMTFQCDRGQIRTLYGDQQVDRECYLTTFKPSS